MFYGPSMSSSKVSHSVGNLYPYLTHGSLKKSRSTASRSPVLTRGGICVPSTVTYLPCRVSGSTLTAVGRSQLLAQWPGTLSRILSGIQRAAQTVLGVYLKRTCSRVTSASSTLRVLDDGIVTIWSIPLLSGLLRYGPK